MSLIGRTLQRPASQPRVPVSSKTKPHRDGQAWHSMMISYTRQSWAIPSTWRPGEGLIGGYFWKDLGVRGSGSHLWLIMI